MKITRVESFFVAIPFEHGAPKPKQGAGGIRTTLDAVYVRVETDAGLTGWGECFGFNACPVTDFAIRKVVGPMAVGRDCDDIDAIMFDLHKRVQSMGRNSPLIFALSGIDIALWDIAGQAKGLPVHRLLGSDGSTTRVEAYASLQRLETPEYVRKVCGEVLRRGYRNVKLHERTVEAVAAAREALGAGFPLMLDTNCQWSLPQAIEMAQRLKPYGLAWLEEPVFPPDDYKALAALRKATDIPVAAGENLGNLLDCDRILDSQAVDVVQPDPTKIGGITECWKAVRMALSRGVKVEPHSPLYGPGLAATLHMIAAMPQPCLAEFYYADLAVSPLGQAAIPQNGFLNVPQGPGLGIDVDVAALEKYRVSM